MAHNKNEWANKVFGLIRAGNASAATAQIKVAPTVGDLQRLQALVVGLPNTKENRQLATVVDEELALLSAPRLHRAP
ncbi:hypothetical protein N0K08_01870 [Acidovorax sp. Be4]|jgi:hypothetical protein|uniref:Uncharacterized protein n=1 Tax=Acidovorax bellezanensis TaxID=2976702 RepID=A0ABT2PJD1_9BURK|nr:hypothetical protein [Acidovorax sp. Be4]MCT9809372.1 hypothetical protein [Acidovorax sp. Be4]